MENEKGWKNHGERTECREMLRRKTQELTSQHGLGERQGNLLLTAVCPAAQCSLSGIVDREGEGKEKRACLSSMRSTSVIQSTLKSSQ